MIHIALSDSDRSYLNYINELLYQIFTSYNICIDVTKFSDGRKLLHEIEANKSSYDLIFTEIKMKYICGFKIAKRLIDIKYKTKLIFLTYNTSLIQEGYKYSAFRYILKDNIYSELSEAVHSFVLVNNYLNENNMNIKLKCRNGYLFDYVNIKRNDIIYFYKNDRTTFVKTIYGEYQLLQYPLIHYKEELCDNRFIIVQRSFLLNLYHVKKLVGDYFILSNNDSLCIGYEQYIKNRIRNEYSYYLEK